MASAVTGLELLLIYVLSRISRVLMNRELKAANVGGTDPETPGAGPGLAASRG